MLGIKWASHWAPSILCPPPPSRCCSAPLVLLLCALALHKRAKLSPTPPSLAVPILASAAPPGQDERGIHVSPGDASHAQDGAGNGGGQATLGMTLGAGSQGWRRTHSPAVAPQTAREQTLQKVWRLAYLAQRVGAAKQTSPRRRRPRPLPPPASSPGSLCAPSSCQSSWPMVRMMEWMSVRVWAVCRATARHHRLVCVHACMRSFPATKQPPPLRLPAHQRTLWNLPHPRRHRRK